MKRENFPPNVKRRQEKALEQVMNRIKCWKSNSDKDKNGSKLKTAQNEKKILEERIKNARV